MLLSDTFNETPVGWAVGRCSGGRGNDTSNGPTPASFCSADACSIRKRTTRVGRLLLGGSGDVRNANLFGDSCRNADQGGVRNGMGVANEKHVGPNITIDGMQGFREPKRSDNHGAPNASASVWSVDGEREAEEEVRQGPSIGSERLGVVTATVDAIGRDSKELGKKINDDAPSVISKVTLHVYSRCDNVVSVLLTQAHQGYCTTGLGVWFWMGHETFPQRLYLWSFEFCATNGNLFSSRRCTPLTVCVTLPASACLC